MYVVTLTCNTLNIDDKIVCVLFDKNGIIWFKYSDILRLLGYRNVQKAMQNMLIDSKQFYEINHRVVLKRNTKPLVQSLRSVKERERYVNEKNLFCILTKTNSVQSKEFIKEYFNTISHRIRYRGNDEQTTISVVVLQLTTELIKQFNIENCIKSVYGYICIYEDKIVVPYDFINSYKLIYTNNLNSMILTYKCGTYSYSMLCYIPIIWAPFTDIIKQRFMEKKLKKYVDGIGYSTIKELKTDIIQCIDEIRYAICQCIICNVSYKLNAIERHKCKRLK